ncbi:hypothetical protein P879_01820 [Paragonimus westermani]|uniref:RRM domain-containing protein n=1 Tax=Paragonimus westermani TaxID=34504 RepID=A0A8T0DUC2_9TREM|nr:hypothetical protein P879_01820 [Paragonimus westermani]
MAVANQSAPLLPQTSLYVGDLNPQVAESSLYTLFSRTGGVLSARICRDSATRNSLGYGYVNFEDPKDAERALEDLNYEKEECAERAIEKINGMLICGRVVFVGKFIPSCERKSASGKLHFNNIYVKNFPPDTTDEKLKEMFSEFGEIKSCCVEKDAEGKSKGFVCFLNPDHAEQAVKTMYGKELAGRTLYANRAQRKGERQEELKQRLEKQRLERQSKYVPGVNLYVKNLDDTIDDERLKEAFCHYGSITSAKVMTDPSARASC